jgi:hypothetical protein
MISTNSVTIWICGQMHQTSENMKLQFGEFDFYVKQKHWKMSKHKFYRMINNTHTHHYTKHALILKEFVKVIYEK